MGMKKWLWNVGESYYLKNGWEKILPKKREKGFSLLEILLILLICKPWDALIDLIRIKPEE